MYDQSETQKPLIFNAKVCDAKTEAVTEMSL